MELKTGDRLRMKKKHPCGGDLFEVLRAGMDVRLRCLQCGRQILLLRRDTEKNIREILPNEPTDTV